MSATLRRLLTLLLAVIAGAVAYHYVPEPLPEISRAEFLAEVRSGHVKTVEIEDQQVILSESTTLGLFRTGFDRRQDVNLPDELRALGVEVWFSKSPPGI